MGDANRRENVSAVASLICESVRSLLSGRVLFFFSSHFVKSSFGNTHRKTHDISFPSSVSVLKADFCINSLIRGHVSVAFWGIGLICT